jgi:DNA invertase Pin-like site-specific DNA recombinase
MLRLTPSSKIRPDHLERQAIIYVRQSTPMQVRENRASTERQYDLRRRAHDLGWPSEHIEVIDQDQAHSGASLAGRDGFQYILVEVGLGHVGALFSLEVSRLARSCSDWYRMLEICALTDTLVIDEDGVYDPGQYNDRLLLGIKGTMSEAELHWLRCRLLGGKLEKAQHGQLRFRPPTGLVFDPAGQVVRDPDEQVAHAVQLLFAVFEQRGSALGVVRYFAQQQLQFPTRLWGGTQQGELVWETLRHERVLEVLHNPAYAGVYVYGRTQTRSKILPGEAPRIKGRTRQVPQQDWPIVLPDAHAGYISWEQYQRNQQKLQDNRTYRPQEQRGAVREGGALLQGIVVCGKCGRRMGVRYLPNGVTPSYDCGQAHKQLGERTCQMIRGDGVDAAVARVFLEAMQPAQLAVSLATLEQAEEQAHQVERQWQLRRERAQYEADLARRRFIAVDPENRLVGRSLEREWNEKLAAVERLEREYGTLARAALPVVSAEERQRILELAQDLPVIWQAATTKQTERKQLLRFLIKDVTLTLAERKIRIAIRWQTDACTELEILRPQRSCDLKRTDERLVARVRELAAQHTDREVARLLNEEGYHAGMGGPLSANKVQWIRHAYGIPLSCPAWGSGEAGVQRADGRHSARAAARLLNVTVSTISDWCKSGRLDGIQAVAHGAWWIRLSEEQIAQLRKPQRRVWRRRTEE